MFDGNQKLAWNHTLALGMMINKAMGGTGPNVIDLIPKRYREDGKPRSAKHEEAESALAFAELEAGLKALSRQWEPKIAGFTR
jgi:hypothetical protein